MDAQHELWMEQGKYFMQDTLDRGCMQPWTEDWQLQGMAETYDIPFQTLLDLPKCNGGGAESGIVGLIAGVCVMFLCQLACIGEWGFSKKMYLVFAMQITALVGCSLLNNPSFLTLEFFLVVEILLFICFLCLAVQVEALSRPFSPESLRQRNKNGH